MNPQLGRILKNEAIDEVATQAPTDADRRRLAGSPALGAEGLFRLAVGPDLLAAIREALKDPEAYAPVVERNRSQPSPRRTPWWNC